MSYEFDVLDDLDHQTHAAHPSWSMSRRAVAAGRREQSAPETSCRAVSACVLCSCCMCGQLYVMTVPPAACSFYVCGLALCATIHAIPHASQWVEARVCMISLKK